MFVSLVVVIIVIMGCMRLVLVSRVRCMPMARRVIQIALPINARMRPMKNLTELLVSVVIRILAYITAFVRLALMARSLEKPVRVLRNLK